MNVHQIDAAYRSFPSFAEWAKLPLDDARWEKSVAGLPRPGSLPRDQLAQAHRIAMRAAAVDTGAIEGLYDVDRGFTMTIALQTAAWESVLEARGEKVRSLIESQMHAYEYVVDLATEREPVSEMWIRALHERICESQDTYPVLTEVGWQNHPLPKGQYKSMPNHVRLPDGGFHAYSPVDLVPTEMHRLVQELRTDEFRGAHPVLQSAYAHYALVGIHPFADGNGRVARALASVFTYRSHSIPLLILVEHKPAYLAALRRADEGEPQAFVEFVFDRTTEAIQLVEQTLQAAAAPDPEEEAANLRAVYLTRGGYSQAQVDAAGLNLLQAIAAEFERQATSLRTEGQITITQQLLPSSDSLFRQPTPRSGYRLAVSAKAVRVAMEASAPAWANVAKGFAVELPVDPDAEDEVLLLSDAVAEPFTARLRELLPASSTVLQMRLGVFIRRVLGQMLAELREKAVTSLHGGSG
ncbi:MAG TPA: Fic family protein [Longimicrobium sp.]|nr:Fic family protein [Longimicrobium sp.]